MQATLVISLDFELFWGMQDCSTLEKYQENVLGGRKAIPELLEMFQKHDVHATWATVGFQFAQSFDEVQKYFPKEKLRPVYKNRRLSTYNCFQYIGKNEDEAPCFYAPSLIKKIAQYDGQEIASHTFSHYYCKEPGQTGEQFRADMTAAINIAEEYGYKLTSVVLPRNQCTSRYITILKELGFTAYRDEENDWIHKKISFRPLMRSLRLMDVYVPLTGQGGYVPKNEEEIINLMGSRMYKPFFKPLSVLERMKVHRIKKQMLHAAKKGLMFHLWWHPHNIGIMTEYHLKQLEEILCYYDELREKYNMRSLNMRESAEEILNG